MKNHDDQTLTIKAGVKLIRATDLEPEPVRWVWKDWLAAGKLHILVGAPGTGKTTIALSLAAIITRGGQWPDGTHAELGNVLIWSGEDDPKDTLLPRLLAHGADRRRIYFVSDINESNKTRAFDPSRDIQRLYDKAAQIGDIRLMIVDPVVNVVFRDSHKNVEVRRDLQPLVDLGHKLGSVILGISHFTKGTSGRDPIERVTGSIAFSALARVVLAAANVTDKNKQVKQLFVRAKSNNGPNGGGYHYQIEQVELTNYQGLLSSRVIWGDRVEGSAQELLADINNPGTSDAGSVLAEAIDFLRVLLANGSVSKKEIDKKAEEAGFNSITVRKAKAFLGLEAVHEGYGKGSDWKWRLPSKMIKEFKDDPLNRVNTFE